MSQTQSTCHYAGLARQLIIERYIHREILQRFVWITGLLLIIITTNKFMDYLGDAASGRIPPEYVLKLLWLRMLAMQTEVLPLMLFLAITLAFSRMNQDNELAVMAAAGMGRRFQLRIVMHFCLAFSLLFSLVVFVGVPVVKQQIYDLKRLAWQEASFSALAAGKFREINKGENVVYIEKLSDNKKNMKNVFLQIRENDKSSVLKSDSAYFEIDNDTGNRYIVFENGRRYQGTPGMLDFRITEYEKYAALIEINEEIKTRDDPEAMSTPDLFGSSDPEHQAELQWRISAIIICILLSILGVVLNQYPFGQKPFTLLIFGIMIYFIYSNLLGISQTLLEKDKLPAIIGLWWVHVLVILIILAIYHYMSLRQLFRNNSDIQVLTADR